MDACERFLVLISPVAVDWIRRLSPDVVFAVDNRGSPSGSSPPWVSPIFSVSGHSIPAPFQVPFQVPFRLQAPSPRLFVTSSSRGERALIGRCAVSRHWSDCQDPWFVYRGGPTRGCRADARCSQPGGLHRFRLVRLPNGGEKWQEIDHLPPLRDPHQPNPKRRVFPLALPISSNTAHLLPSSASSPIFPPFDFCSAALPVPSPPQTPSLFSVAAALDRRTQSILDYRSRDTAQLVAHRPP